MKNCLNILPVFFNKKSYLPLSIFAVLLIALTAERPCTVLSAYEPDRSVMSEKYWKIWNPEVMKKIDDRIEKYRKADAVLNLKNIKPGSDVSIKQINHEFKFGGNTFLFGQFDTPEKNSRYAAIFGDLFNSATVAFYWKTLEPEEGKIRFTADSPRIYRRPPTDPVIEYCEKRGLNIHGHAIIYGIRIWGHPEWLPNNRKAMEPYFERHIRQIAERYDKRVNSWDVVNESIDQANRGIMPDDYLYKSFRWAEKYFSKEVRFSCNDCTFAYPPNLLRRYVEIARDLKDRGAKLDMFGLQAHIYSPALSKKIAEGAPLWDPKTIWNVFDIIRDAELPVHISEITVSAPTDDTKGQEVQAIITSNLYRIWFSDKNSMGITWWNAADNGAAPGEPSLSGLIDKNCNKKKVYYALDDLINHKWKTNLKIKATSPKIAFRGFRGQYEISWTDTTGKIHKDPFTVK